MGDLLVRGSTSDPAAGHERAATRHRPKHTTIRTTEAVLHLGALPTRHPPAGTSPKKRDNLAWLRYSLRKALEKRPSGRQGLRRFGERRMRCPTGAPFP